MKKILLFSLFSLLSASCTSTLMGPTTVLCNGHVEDLKKTSIGSERVRGTASEHTFLLSHLILGESAPQRAVETAVAQGGKNCIGLTDTSLTARIVWWIPFLYSEYTFTAEGTPIYRP